MKDEGLTWIVKIKKITLIDAQTSHRITSLRFLLAVLVVFIHNNFTAENLAKTLEKKRSADCVQSK